MCASAPALRVFFRRYLGILSASRSQAGASGATGLGESSTVVRATQVKFDKQEKAGFELSKPHDFDTTSEEEIEAWSANRSQERLTHEEDIYAMTDLSGKQYRKEPR
jgi:NADH:ubiquinone oxidoreductase subunit D